MTLSLFVRESFTKGFYLYVINIYGLERVNENETLP